VSDPKVADTSPAVLELEPGAYWWCACGYSENQPFCDGSHKEHGMAPQKLEITDRKKVALCRCKHTGNAPFCDGSHSRL
jgi:CDGSH-type Zn-finger protein